MPKINIPLGLDGSLDKTDESMKLSELIYNPNRTDSGQGMYISKTSQIEYNTDDYPDDPEIYNKGDIGLIHIFWKTLGGADGFLMLADDANSYMRPSGDATGEENAEIIDADTLGGNPPSYYLNYNNLTNRPTLVDYAILANYTLSSSQWVESNGVYQQQITLSGFSFLPSSQVDFDADFDNISLISSPIIPFNDNGTVYARTLIPPSSDITIQLTIRKITQELS